MVPQDHIPTQMPTLTVNTRDAKACQEVLASLPLTSVSTAHGVLKALLQAMKKAPPPATGYLAVLESAREPLAFLQDALAERYAAKPLPARAEETAAFERVLELWRLMADSYAQVARIGGANAEIQKRLALICQRCVHYAGRIADEHFRGHRALANGVWIELHGYEDTAQEWGLASEKVSEPLGSAGGMTTANATFGAVLLISLANPYSRTAKELAWIHRWVELLAPETDVRPPNADVGGRGYGIDLMRDQGPLPVENIASTPSARLFDTSRLTQRMQEIMARLKEGETPAALGLGEDCPTPQAVRLLRQLYRPWCLAAMPRRFQRDRASGTIAAAYDMDSIYFHVAGNDFVQPQHARSYSAVDIDRIVTFRNQLDPTKPLRMHTSQLGIHLDTWDVADRSVHGLRVFRDAAGPRIEHGQLLAFKEEASDRFRLGRISWLVQEKDGRLQAGIHVLTDAARGVAVRPTGLAVSKGERYLPAFLLPAEPAIKEPLSVLVAANWYQPGRVVEVFTDRSIMLRLDELLDRGPNFDRCTFSLVTPATSA